MKVTTHIWLSFQALFVWCSTSINANFMKSICDVEQHELSNTILSLSSSLSNEIGGVENFFFSPLSIFVSLAMLYVGTGGTTELEMSHLLQQNFVGKLPLKRKITEEFEKLFTSLKNEQNDALKFIITNGIFTQLGYPVSANYASTLKNFFKADINYSDFQKDESLSQINEWVSKSTKGMIPELLDQPLSALTRMVLLNAVYFKGLWQIPFPKKNTFIGSFTVSDGTSRSVSLMRGVFKRDKSLNYYYHEYSKHHVLEMRYSESDASMLLMLPSNRHEFPDFDLTTETFCLLKREMRLNDVTVIMPKFKFDYMRELDKDMRNLGLKELFSERSNLTGIRKQNDLHVSRMFHRAVIEVNGFGTKASAATAVEIESRTVNENHITLMFDHPFLFYIVNKKLGLVLFRGRVSDLSDV